MANTRKMDPSDLPEEPREEYVLKLGAEHNGIDEYGVPHLYKGDDPNNNKVMLTQSQYNQFTDKFNSVEEDEAKKKALSDLAAAQDELQALKDNLTAAGISLDDLMALKPVPTPSQDEITPAGQAIGEVSPAPASSAGPVQKTAPLSGGTEGGSISPASHGKQSSEKVGDQSPVPGSKK